MVSVGGLGGFLQGLAQGIQYKREHKLAQQELDLRRQEIESRQQQMQATLDRLEREEQRAREASERAARQWRAEGFRNEEADLMWQIEQKRAEQNDLISRGLTDAAAEMQGGIDGLLRQKSDLDKRQRSLYEDELQAGAEGGDITTPPSGEQGTSASGKQAPSAPASSAQDAAQDADDPAKVTPADLEAETRTGLGGAVGKSRAMVIDEARKRSAQVGQGIREKLNTKGVYEKISRALSGQAFVDMDEGAPVILVPDISQPTSMTETRTGSSRSTQGVTQGASAGARVSGGTTSTSSTSVTSKPIFEDVQKRAFDLAESAVREMLQQEGLLGMVPNDEIRAMAEQIRVLPLSTVAGAESESAARGMQSYALRTIQSTRKPGELLPGESKDNFEALFSEESPVGLEAVLFKQSGDEIDQQVVNGLDEETINELRDQGYQVQYRFKLEEDWDEGDPEAVAEFLRLQSMANGGKLPEDMEVPTATELLPKFFREISTKMDGMKRAGMDWRVNVFSEDVNPAYSTLAVGIRDKLKKEVTRYTWDQRTGGDYDTNYRLSQPEEVADDFVEELEKATAGVAVPAAKEQRVGEILETMSGFASDQLSLNLVSPGKRRQLLKYLADNESEILKGSATELKIMPGERTPVRVPKEGGSKKNRFLLEQLRIHLRGSVGGPGIPTAPGPTPRDDELERILKQIRALPGGSR